MLLGGAAEIEATERFQREFVEGRGASLVPVIEALRASLRDELGIEAVDLPDEFTFRLRLEVDEK